MEIKSIPFPDEWKVNHECKNCIVFDKDKQECKFKDMKAMCFQKIEEYSKQIMP